jgi:hypothetical protein
MRTKIKGQLHVCHRGVETPFAKQDRLQRHSTVTAIRQGAAVMVSFETKSRVRAFRRGHRTRPCAPHRGLAPGSATRETRRGPPGILRGHDPRPYAAGRFGTGLTCDLPCPIRWPALPSCVERLPVRPRIPPTACPTARCCPWRTSILDSRRSSMQATRCIRPWPDSTQGTACKWDRLAMLGWASTMVLDCVSPGSRAKGQRRGYHVCRRFRTFGSSPCCVGRPTNRRRSFKNAVGCRNGTCRWLKWSFRMETLVEARPLAETAFARLTSISENRLCQHANHRTPRPQPWSCAMVRFKP